jgi:hypothetical protein
MDFKNFKDDKHYVFTLAELREIIREEIKKIGSESAPTPATEPKQN